MSELFDASNLPRNPQNALLRLLPDPDFDLISRFLEPVPLARGQVLQERNRALESAYFIESGAAAMFHRTRRDGLVGVAVIARYGLVGLPTILGTATSPQRCVVQISGQALRISSTDLQYVLSESAALRQVMKRYLQALMTQYAQRVLCASRHKLEQRLSSWLLAINDRVDGERIEITHDLISQMLGTRRASVSIAAQHLEKIGAISGGRGFLNIADRSVLESCSCECYKAMADEYARLLDRPLPAQRPIASGQPAIDPLAQEAVSAPTTPAPGDTTDPPRG
jgi:CRP-like cAMP-binding protein